MAIILDPNYRIKRNAVYDDQMRYLMQEKFFDQYSQILVFSAIVGYNFDKYIPFDKNAEPVQMSFFNERDRDIMNLIAYAHTKDQNILRENPIGMYKIFESYANGGFPILVSKLGIDFVNKDKNDRLQILRRYYGLLLGNKLLGRK